MIYDVQILSRILGKKDKFNLAFQHRPRFGGHVSVQPHHPDVRHVLALGGLPRGREPSAADALSRIQVRKEVSGSMERASSLSENEETLRFICRTGRERIWGPFLRHPLEHPLPRLQYF